MARAITPVSMANLTMMNWVCTGVFGKDEEEPMASFLSLRGGYPQYIYLLRPPGKNEGTLEYPGLSAKTFRGESVL